MSPKNSRSHGSQQSVRAIRITMTYLAVLIKVWTLAKNSTTDDRLLGNRLTGACFFIVIRDFELITDINLGRSGSFCVAKRDSKYLDPKTSSVEVKVVDDCDFDLCIDKRRFNLQNESRILEYKVCNTIKVTSMTTPTEIQVRIWPIGTSGNFTFIYLFLRRFVSGALYDLGRIKLIFPHWNKLAVLNELLALSK